MWFLFDQVWFWLIVSFVLGYLAHWYFHSESNKPTIQAPLPESLKDTKNLKTAETPKATASKIERTEVKDLKNSPGEKPVTLDSAPKTPDDLKKIKGIGPVNEKALNTLGIYRFSQIADWTPENINWIETSLSFTGRIQRENWVAQAKAMVDPTS